MQRILRIFSAAFVVVAAMAVMKAIQLIVSFRSTRLADPAFAMQHHLVAFSLGMTVCWALASVHFGIAWMLWSRKRLRLLTFYGIIALLGFASGILAFQIGAMLAVALLVALILPRMRSSFLT